MTAIQAIDIRNYEERSNPKPHTVYRIDIQAHVRSWQMWRRYSEFDDLHTELTKSTGSPPPCALPPKHKYSILRSRKDVKVLEERKEGLERYLRAILSARDEKWRENFSFKEFLGVPVGRQGGFSSASWLDEHLELQGRIRDIRAEINKRDAFSDRGDIAESHKANVGAKTTLAGVLSRIGTLGKGLQDLGMNGMSEGELQRRTDMVARLQDDCEKLGKMVTVARQTSRPGGTGPSGMANPALETDREALLGVASKPITRIFGAPPPQPKETEQTRPLDDHGLMSLQQTQIQQQDNQLSQLTTILQRQRQLGEAIGSEISYQIGMLDELSNDVDLVGGKLKTTNRQLNRLG
ncbi:syntaxin [Infundibulicybe gibba]|nr:syntaxin [Infundibulicybe gibba]